MTVHVPTPTAWEIHVAMLTGVLAATLLVWRCVNLWQRRRRYQAVRRLLRARYRDN